MCVVCIGSIVAETEYKLITKKPDDYPNFDDSQFIKSLAQNAHPSRMKRDLEYKNCDSVDDNKSCCAEIKDITIYAIEYKGKRVNVIQSKYLNQTIREVSCRMESHPCFSGLSIDENDYEPVCKTVRGKFTVMVEHNTSVDIAAFTADIDCSCVLKKK